jgi:hypothetical protein
MDFLNDTSFPNLSFEFDSSRLSSVFSDPPTDSVVDETQDFAQAFVNKFDLSDGSNEADFDLFASVPARTSLSDIEQVLQLQAGDATAEWRELPSFNRDFSSALSFGEPPAKAVCRSSSYKLKTEGLPSIPSLPSLANFRANQFPQSADPIVKAESVISPFKVDFQLGGLEELEENSKPEFQQIQALVPHDQEFLNAIMQTSKITKPSTAVPKRVDAFKCRETAKQRQQRYNDIEKTNKMLKESVKEARETVDAALEVLLALWADGKCDLDILHTPKCQTPQSTKSFTCVETLAK